MADYINPTKNSKVEHVGIYIGSFDPIHYGHLEVINVILKYVNRIVILPNNPNHHKTNRYGLSDRISMINFTLDNFIHKDKVTISDDDCDKYVESIRSEKYIVGFLGSDSYNILAGQNKMPKLNADKWYVIPRIGYDVKTLAPWNKPVTFLPENDFSRQYISSTMVRNKIFTDCDFTELKNEIDENVHAYIKQHELYPLSMSILNFIKNNMDIEKYKFIKNNVILINDNTIAKIFFNEQSYAKEIKSNKLAQNIKIVHTPRILNQLECPKYYIIIFEYVGSSSFDLVIDNFDPYIIGYDIGKALAMLHNYKITCSTKQLLGSNKQIGKLKKILPIDHVKKLYENSQILTLCHGDCSLYNFIINIKGDNFVSAREIIVYMIDIGKMIDSRNNGVSIGIPEYDYYQFISSVYWTSIDNETKKNIASSFEEGYRRTIKFEFDRNFNAACKLYWSANYRGAIPVKKID